MGPTAFHQQYLNGQELDWRLYPIHFPNYRLKSPWAFLPRQGLGAFCDCVAQAELRPQQNCHHRVPSSTKWLAPLAMTGGADGVASSTTVGGQRGRRWGLSHSASANELLVLGPAAVAVRERPDRADAAIVVRSSDHDDTGVG